MRRTALLIGLALAVAAPSAIALGSASRATTVGVAEREWRISLYRTRVPTGVVRFSVHNYGEDDHDLAIRNRDGRVLGAMPEVGSGEGDTLRVRLRHSGRYVVFCSLEGHEAKGMRARLVVVKRKRSA